VTLDQSTLFELKQVNLVCAYFAACTNGKCSYAGEKQL